MSSVLINVDFFIFISKFSCCNLLITVAYPRTLCLLYLPKPEILKCRNGFFSPRISELEPPFDSPLFFGFSCIESSKILNLTLCHYDPQILEPRFAKMSKHTSTISFVFHDFGISNVECSAPCPRECRKPDSQNPDKYSIMTFDFGLSSLLNPYHSSSGLPKLRTSKFWNSELITPWLRTQNLLSHFGNLLAKVLSFTSESWTLNVRNDMMTWTDHDQRSMLTLPFEGGFFQLLTPLQLLEILRSLLIQEFSCENSNRSISLQRTFCSNQTCNPSLGFSLYTTTGTSCLFLEWFKGPNPPELPFTNSSPLEGFCMHSLWNFSKYFWIFESLESVQLCNNSYSISQP